MSGAEQSCIGEENFFFLEHHEQIRVPSLVLQLPLVRIGDGRVNRAPCTENSTNPGSFLLLFRPGGAAAQSFDRIAACC